MPRSGSGARRRTALLGSSGTFCAGADGYRRDYAGSLATTPRGLTSPRRRTGGDSLLVASFPKAGGQRDLLQLAASMPVLALGTHIAEAGDLSSRDEAGAYVLYSFMQAVMTAEIKR